MTGSSSVGQVVSRRRPRILVVQSGMERSDTLDLLRDLAPENVETVDDVYEAVARVGLANARDRVETVVVPITIPEFSAPRIVEAFELCDRRVRLVLLAPSGRNDAMEAAIQAGFVDAVEMPASPSRLGRAVGIESGIVPPRPVEIERSPHPLDPLDPLDRHESRPVSSPRKVREVLAEASRPTSERIETPEPPIEAFRSLGDVDLVAEIMSDAGNLRATSLAMIRAYLSTEDVHLLLADESVSEDGRATAKVVHGEFHLGTLVSTTVATADLVPWASWLAVWMSLERHIRGLERLTETDELTGAGNRRAFERILAETLVAAGNERRLVTLMVFDIDNFKTYNDRYGHEAGDQVLRETVDLLRSTIRRGDHVFRIGGDEFVVIFSDTEGPRTERSAPPDSVESIAYRFQEKVCELRFPQLGLDADGSLSISAGLATFPWDGLDGATLLRRADQLALESKRSGKNALRFGPGARSRCERREADDDQA
jgi:diguanylate cyclase (GGDEF)-like protein